MPGRASELAKCVVAMEQAQLNVLNDSYRVALVYEKIARGQRSG